MKASFGTLQKRGNFWKNRRVFITGHTGFKGGWLCFWLSQLGARVTGYSLSPPTTPNFFASVGVADIITAHHQGDVRHSKTLTQAIKRAQPEIIFHLAAQPLVRESYLQPTLTYHTNVIGVVNVLEAMRQTESAAAAVIVTSDKCYENAHRGHACRETDILGGHDPYSSSKACAEIAVSSLRRSFFSDDNAAGVATARAGNVIGGGDWAQDRIIPDAARAFAAGKTLHVRNPLAVRPWQHVLEPLAGYLSLAEHLYREPRRYGEAWNFGPFAASIKPVSKVVQLAKDAWGKNTDSKIISDQGYHESAWLKLDSSKAKKLGWKPKLSLARAVNMSIEWYQAFYTNHNINQLKSLSLRHLKEYEDAAN